MSKTGCPAAGSRAERMKELSQCIENKNIKASEIDPALICGYTSIYNRYMKRVLDILLSAALLLLLWPIYLVVAIAILTEDGAPVFYRAERGGYHNVPFRIFKFRTMVKNADQIGGGTTALNDERITKTGRLLRKLKVDEFANLFSILKGDMSFIGPRPELLRYTEEYRGTEKLILEVRPGITDYSSIEFINLDEIVGSGNADEMYERYVLPRKNKLRVKYAASVSFATDVKLFFLTVGKVIEKAVRVLSKNKG